MAVQEIAGKLITGLRYGEGVTVIIIIHMHEAERENRRRSRGCELYHPVASAFPRTPKEFILMQMDGEFGHGGHEREMDGDYDVHLLLVVLLVSPPRIEE